MKKSSSFIRLISATMAAMMLFQSAIVDTNFYAFAVNNKETTVSGNSLKEDVVFDDDTLDCLGDEEDYEKIRLYGTAADSFSITLSFETLNQDEVAYYELYRDSEKVTNIPVSAENVYSYRDRKVEYDKSYSYKITAFDKDGNSLFESDTRNFKFGDDLTIYNNGTTKGYVLQEDMVINNLYLYNGTLDLNGHSLTVLGDVDTRNGYDAILIFNKGCLECSNLYLDELELIMKYSEDHLVINKELYFNDSSDSATEISDGTIEIRGDVNTDRSDDYYWRPINNNKIFINGYKKQNINMPNSYYYYNYHYLYLRNPSKDGVCFKNQICAKNIDYGNTKCSYDRTDATDGYTLTEDITVDGDFVLGLNELNLNGYTMTVKGDFYQLGGCININKGKLIVEGSFASEYFKEGEKNYIKTGETVNSNNHGDGFIIMNNKEDYMLVKGNFYTQSFMSEKGFLTDGIMEVKGSFKTSSTNYYTGRTEQIKENFAASDNFTLVLSGTKYQEIFMGGSSSLCSVPNLVIKNTSDKGVYLSDIYVTNSYNENVKTTTGNLIFSGNTDDLNLVSDVELKLQNITLENDFEYDKDIYIYDGYFNLNGHRLVCKGNLTFSGSQLIMDNEEDRLVVEGNLNFYSSNDKSHISAGIIECKGDFDISGNVSCFSGTNRLILNGDKEQSVYCYSSIADTKLLNIVEIKNTVRIISINNFEKYVKSLINTSGCEIIPYENIGVNNLELKEYTTSIKLQNDEVWNENVALNGGSIDLNGHTLEIKGYLYQTNGYILLNNGTLIVDDYYTISSGKGKNTGISFKNANDKVIVYGRMGYAANNYTNLSNGTLELKGDLSVLAGTDSRDGKTKNYYNLQTSGGFKMVFSGDKEQSIATNSSYNTIANIENNNTSEEGVRYNSVISVSGTYKENGNKHTGKLVLMPGAEVIGNEINGDVELRGNISKDLELNGKLIVANNTTPEINANVTVYEDVELSGTLTLARCHLICKKDFKYCSTVASLVFNEENNIQPELSIFGDFNIPYYSSDEWTNGLINIYGDFIVDYTKKQISDYAVHGLGKNKVIMCGDAPQIIDFKYTSDYLNEIVFANKSGKIDAPHGIPSSKYTIEDGCTVNGEKGYDSGFKLTVDKTIDSYNLAYGDIDLSGHTLTINGDFNQLDGTVNINNGTLIVKGDYYIGNANNSQNNALLKMINDGDTVIVYGNLIIDSGCNSFDLMNAGVIEIKGDLLQKNTSNNCQMTGDIKLVLSGSKKQNVELKDINKIKTNDKDACLNIVEILNTSNEGVEFINAVPIKGQLITNGKKAYGSICLVDDATLKENSFGGTIYLKQPRTISDKWTIGGDLYIESASSYNNVKVSSDLSVAGNIYIYSMLEIDNAVVSCKNVERIKSSSGAFLNSSLIKLDTDSSYLRIDGDLLYHEYGFSVNKGTIEVKGNISGNFENAYSKINIDKLILSGESRQDIEINTSSTFNTVELQNPNRKGVYFNVGFLNASKLIDNNVPVHYTNESIEAAVLQDDVTYEGDIYFSAKEFDLNGHTMTVNGNLYLENGDFKINGGKLIVNGNLCLQKVLYDEDKQIKSIIASSAYLNMDGDNPGYIFVAGNFNYQSMRSIYLKNGTLEIKGNINSIGQNNLYFNYQDFTLLLSGENKQNINISYKDTYLRITNLVIENTSEAGVTSARTLYIENEFNDKTGRASVNTIVSASDYDKVINKQTPCKIIFRSFTLSEDISMDSFNVDKGGNVDLNGHTVTANNMDVAGYLYLNNGNIKVKDTIVISGHVTAQTGKIEAGNINVCNGGNFKINNAEVITNELYINGSFNMYDKKCRVEVNGLCTLDKNGYMYLDAGRLVLHDDFIQLADAYISANTSGTNIVELCGKEGAKQKVYFERTSNKFNRIVLDKEEDQYDFSDLIEKMCYQFSEADTEKPEKVTNITLVENTSKSIKFTWDIPEDNRGIYGYLIYRDGKKIADVEKNEYLDSVYTPDTKCDYYIIAYDEAQNFSDMSDIVTFSTKTDTVAPTGASITSLTNKSSVSVQLNCSAYDDIGVSYYEIYKNGEFLAKVTESKYIDTAISLGNTYTYYVVAYDGANNKSNNSASVTYTPSTPAIFKIYPEDNSTIYTYTNIYAYYKPAINDPSSIQIQFREYGSSGDWTEIDNRDYKYNYDNTTSYRYKNWDVDNLKSGKYEVKITLMDEGGYSDTKTVTYTVDKEAPLPPTTLYATSRSSKVELCWSKSPSGDAATYYIYRSDSKNGVHTLCGSTSELNYTDSNVIEDKTYYYYVSAKDGYREGEQSEGVSVLVLNDDVPPVVESFTCNEKINKTVTITTKATDNKGVDSMSLYIKGEKDSEMLPVVINRQATNGTAQFVLNTLDYADGKYELYCTARDICGNESDSDSMASCIVWIDNTGTEKVCNLTGKAFSSYCELNWSPVGDKDIKSYRVEKEVNGKFENALLIDASNTYCTITGLKANHEYTFRVVGIDELGNEGIPSRELTLYTVADIEPPVINIFSAGNQLYCKNNINIKVDISDNKYAKEAILYYSFDNVEWKELVNKKNDTETRKISFDYNLDISKYSNGEIYFGLIAYDKEGNVTNNDEKKIIKSVIKNTCDNKIVNFKVTPGFGAVTLNWDKINDETLEGFILYKKVNDNDFTKVGMLNPQSVSFIDNKVSEENTYTYKMCPVDVVGNEGEYTKEASAVPLGDTVSPSVVYVAPSTGSVISKITNVEVGLSDAGGLNNITLEYRKAGSESYSQLCSENISGTAYRFEYAWDVSHYNDENYELHIIVSDNAGNVNKDKVLSYEVDNSGPSAPTLSCTPQGYKINLSWSKSDSEDFSVYRLYRKQSDGSYSVLGDTKECGYEDTKLTPGVEYTYKVSAIDKVGNETFSNEVSAVPTSVDGENPVAVCNNLYSLRMGIEYDFDGTRSYDNVGIKSYTWNMGDGTTLDGKCVRHAYTAEGTFDGSLTVVDEAGNTDVQAFKVTVIDKKDADVHISVAMESNPSTFISGAYLAIENSGGEILNFISDSNGCLDIALQPGVYTAMAYCDNHIPATASFAVNKGDKIDVSLLLKEGKLVTGSITLKRIDPDKMQELGIDILEPSNWKTKYYIVSGTLNDGDEEVPYNVTITPGTSVNIGNGGSSGTRCVLTLDNNGTLYLLGYKSYLKDMYQVSLEVINNAEKDSGFDILGTSAELMLPEGLSFVEINKIQEKKVSLGTVKAGKKTNYNWYIKADKDDDYEVKAKVSGTVAKVNAKVDTVISSKILHEKDTDDNTWVDKGFLTAGKVPKTVKVVDKKQFPVRGAIIYVYDTKSKVGAKPNYDEDSDIEYARCVAITNSDGEATVYVNRNEQRHFYVEVLHDNYLSEQIEDYEVKDMSVITIYKEGEVRNEEEFVYNFNRQNGQLVLSGLCKMPECDEEYETVWNGEAKDDKIKSVVIEEGVKSICDGAFKDNINLRTVNIPSSVKKIGKEAFDDTTKLIDIYFNGTKSEWENLMSTFESSEALDYVVIHFNDGTVYQNRIYSGKSRFLPAITSSDKKGREAAGLPIPDGLKDEFTLDYSMNFDWFSVSSYTYLHQLGQMSIKAAMACMGGYTSQYDDGSQNIKDLMDKLKVDYDDDSIHFVPTSESSIGYAIGSKKLYFSDDEDDYDTLIMVTVRGAGYAAEWAGNAWVGEGEHHEGFDTAAKQVRDGIIDYMSKHELYGDRVKVWITGYSRAAATSNLTAAYLDKGLMGLKPENIYAYCFECPKNTTDDSCHDELYNNIFSIVNPNDIVPMVAPGALGWGFDRYGIEYALPSKHNSSDYQRLYDAMWSEYCEICATNKYASRVFAPGVTLYEGVNNYTSFGILTEDAADNLIDSLVRMIPTRVSYVIKDQTTVMSALLLANGAKTEINTGEFFKTIYDILLDYNGILSSVNIISVVPVVDFIAENDIRAHYPELCLAWMDSLKGTASLSSSINPKSYKKIFINCPVDVVVYDKGNNVIAKITNDVADEQYTAISAYVDYDGQKVIVLPDDSDYTYDLIPTDDGQMTVTIEECNDIEDGPLNVNCYQDMVITKGVKYTGKNASGAAEIFDGNNTLVKSTFSLDKDNIVKASVDMLTEGNGTIECAGFYYVPGEFCQLHAVPADGEKFINWTIDGKEVSKDETYRFMVSKDVTVKANFTNNANTPGNDPEPKPDNPDNKPDGNDLTGDTTLAVKQKYAVSHMFNEESKIVKYVVTSDNGGKAKVNKKGILTAAKAGNILVTPMIKQGKKLVKGKSEPVKIIIVKPKFEGSLSGTYIGQIVSANELLKDIPQRNNEISWSVGKSKKPTVSINEKTGEIKVLKKGKAKVTATITNDQGSKVKITKVMNIKLPKLSVQKTIELNKNKSKTIGLKNVPKGKTFSFISTDDTVIGLSVKGKKAKITGLKEGEATVYAVVDDKKYGVNVVVH